MPICPLSLRHTDTFAKEQKQPLRHRKSQFFGKEKETASANPRIRKLSITYLSTHVKEFYAIIGIFIGLGSPTTNNGVKKA